MSQWFLTACTLHESRNCVLYLSEILYLNFLPEIWLVCKYLMELLDKTVDNDDDDYREGRGEEARGGGEGVDREGETSERKARKRKNSK